eukprot:11998564-Karenia_brevis.AAC.1
MKLSCNGQVEEAKFVEMFVGTTTTWKRKHRHGYLNTGHGIEKSMKGKTSRENLNCRKSLGQEKSVQERKK